MDRYAHQGIHTGFFHLGGGGGGGGGGEGTIYHVLMKSYNVY